ncbi:MAG: N-acetylneuraminate synthase [Candidatus Cloacimonetes bacterium]|nr:N-acetylneuraminate synthase [Candidatus Cloacimonadota bacterium]
MAKTFIIAEAGINHNGNIETAFKLIDAAKEASADAVKFQTFTAKQTVSKNTQKADYQKETTDKEESQYDMIRKLELNEEQHQKLISYCNEKGIKFLSSPFDLSSIDLLGKLGLDIFKIPSGEIVNLPYLRKIGSLKKEVLISTGMANLGEIETALDVLVNSGTRRENITILHCTTNYPCPYEEVNLKAILTIKEAFKLTVGYSDHTLGIEVPIAAVAVGATVIEKHFTLNKNMEGPDHKASLEPNELKAMVTAIRNIEKALGNGIKKPNKSEIEIMKVARKSIVAKCKIKKGEIFTKDNLATKRPGTGISPMRWDEILGRKAIHNFEEDEFIEI